MLKTIFSLLTVASFIATSQAQETEGHISYAVEFSSKDPNAQMSLGLLQGSKMDIHFTEDKSRSEMKLGTLMETTTIVDNKKSEMLILMSGMMGKNAVSQPVEKVEETKTNVELLEETKEIIGYSCKKAVITDEEGNRYTLWYTDKIKVASQGQKYFDGKGVPGFPMLMEISQNGMDIKMTATLFEKLPKKHKLFDMSIPEGYKTMTKEELEKMTGGM